MHRRFISVLCALVSVVAVAPLTAATGDSFSFVIVADPHLGADQNGENTPRLQACVDWVNAYKQSRNIDMTFVIGDIGDTNAGLTTAGSILSGLSTPYVPIYGNHDVQPTFENTFGSVHQSLATMAQTPGTGFANWQKGPVHVTSSGSDLNLENIAFEYRGVQFVCPDWSSRTGAFGAELHTMPGGTFDWFGNTLAGASQGKDENVVVVTHIPMLTMSGPTGAFVADYAAFSQSEFGQLSAMISDPNHDYANHLASVYAGHWHCQAYMSEDGDPNHCQLPSFIDPSFLVGENPAISLAPMPGYDMYAIQACCYPAPGLIIANYPPEQIAIQLVTVTEGQTGFSYTSQTIMVPEPVTAAILVLGLPLFGGRRLIGRRSSH